MPTLLDAAFYASFLVGIASVHLAKWQLPALLKYGKTLEGSRTQKGLLGFFEQLTVPKQWFTHFYVYSTTLAILNVYCQRNLVSLLFLIHSGRRLYETQCVTKYGENSRMHLSHYLVGLWFYSVANWAVFESKSRSQLPLVRFLAVLVFALSSVDQYMNHLHLSKLVKYTMPTYGLFSITTSPHYFDEVLLYLSLTAYTGSLKLFACLVWVIVNLSTSALETRAWYLKKFPQTTPPYAIIPFVL